MYRIEYKGVWYKTFTLWGCRRKVDEIYANSKIFRIRVYRGKELIGIF